GPVRGTAKTAERQVLDREVGGRVVGRFDPALERCIVRFIQADVDHRDSSSAWRNAACFGARLVRDHSSSISHFTASSLASWGASSGSGQASSTRWPLGSKK